MNLVMLDIDGTLTQSYEYDREIFGLAIAEVLGCPPIDADLNGYVDKTSTGVTQEAIRRITGKVPVPVSSKKLSAMYWGVSIRCIRNRPKSLARFPARPASWSSCAAWMGQGSRLPPAAGLAKPCSNCGPAALALPIFQWPLPTMTGTVPGLCRSRPEKPGIFTPVPNSSGLSTLVMALGTAGSPLAGLRFHRNRSASAGIERQPGHSLALGLSGK